MVDYKDSWEVMVLAIGTTNRELVTTMGITYRDPTTNSSFLSESYGILSARTTLRKILTLVKVQLSDDKQLSVFSDNLGLDNQRILP
jgi:hypothetical protein